MIATCQLKKPLRNQISMWKHYVSQYDSMYCDNMLDMKRLNSTEELQSIEMEQVFTNYSPNSQMVEEREMALTLENVDEYVIHSLRKSLFSPIQRKKLKCISKGFKWYSIQQFRNLNSSTPFEKVKNLLTQNKEWFMESKLTVMELKLLLNGQSYMHSTLLLNEMDMSRLSSQIRENFEKVVCNLNVHQI
ncbi:hypothetical protein FDP41_004333 [Naegleria fowleri]|uniref:Uncharacterized protein n=1 Tax=Naegleria fowleri TaxID=5763 RepID=A0A6A5BQL2_NAEFO|nr:uncharacterized protein FDP41_004333 [Naegleria fowleri]KAF0976434.1 hypothetical protein FDP41_004333 [Naegleria fowleri]